MISICSRALAALIRVPTFGTPKTHSILVKYKYVDQVPGMIRRFTRSTSPKQSKVAWILISEFKKANIGVSEAGRRVIESAYASAPENTLQDSEDLLEHWTKDKQVGLPPSDSIWCIDHNWRCGEIRSMVQDYKTFKIWEAMYARSEVFKRLIDEDEEILKIDEWEDIRRDRIQHQHLWNLLDGMFSDGIFVRQDYNSTVISSPQQIQSVQNLEVASYRLRPAEL
ncbi:hypothetical protein TWF970_000726 [Orbilia oligospora]|uniref:Uncharacterized protein n=1 Tax=Orbilia oligospora TaxID=2813651 RepID=A0A7C8VRN6_ORBOL|nr:hypothetical protein TWF970_000726 [Orbilia oligospora]